MVNICNASSFSLSVFSTLRGTPLLEENRDTEFLFAPGFFIDMEGVEANAAAAAATREVVRDRTGRRACEDSTCAEAEAEAEAEKEDEEVEDEEEDEDDGAATDEDKESLGALKCFGPSPFALCPCL